MTDSPVEQDLTPETEPRQKRKWKLKLFFLLLAGIAAIIALDTYGYPSEWDPVKDQ